MSDPRRWAEDGGDATELERDLVRAGQAAGPSSEERERIWLGIAGQCGPPAAGAGSGGGSVAAPAKGIGVTALSSLKAVVVAALVGGGAFTGYRAMQRREPATLSPTTNVTASPPVEVSPAKPDPNAPAADQIPARNVAAARSAAPASDEAKRTRASRLAEESRMVLEARNALRSSDPGTALRLLEAARVAFPDGALMQEREALAIEALVRSGQRDLASKRAEAFLRDYPKSPHAADVRRSLVPP